MESREDIPRISVDSVQDWQRLRANYKNAAMHQLNAQVAANSLDSDKAALEAHMNAASRLASRFRSNLTPC